MARTDCLTAEIATKLAKIIPRLATEHEGEMIAAVGAISRTLAGAGLDWHAIAAAVEEAEEASEITLDKSGTSAFQAVRVSGLREILG